MKQQATITKNVTVPPHKLHINEEYVEKQLQKLEGKNYSSEVGYIYRILDILTVEHNTIVKNNFTGSIVYKVVFTVENCNPQQGDEIDCSIVQNNSILLGSVNPLKVIIIQEPNLPKIDLGESIKVQILVTEVNHNAEYIKVVGRFVSKN